MGRPLFTVDELRNHEVAAARSLAPGALMQRAGEAAARRIAQRIGAPPKRVQIICGPGNNGGDGYVCARELARRGHFVECVALAAPAAADAVAAAASWRTQGGLVRDRLDLSSPADVVVDAIFGIGLKRPLEGRFADAADWITAQAGALRVALDVPSGLDADRGAWVGGRAGVVADLTITFLGGKPGLVTGVGVDAAGNVIVEEIGVHAPVGTLALNAPEDFAAFCAPRRRDSHKGTYGSVGVLGGGRGMIGAPLLAARAALRLGAGRVFVECVGAPDLQFDPVYPELMLRPLGSIERLDALVVGCGLGTDAGARAALAAAIERECAIVLDADALNLLAQEPALRAVVAGRARKSVLTPHPLEAARLLGGDSADVQADRLAAARALANNWRAVVVLKGAGSVIAVPDGRAWINPTGGPALATPGSGDVLGGLIASLAAQGDLLQAVLAATWLHGAAAAPHQADVGLVAGDIAALATKELIALRSASG